MASRKVVFENEHGETIEREVEGPEHSLASTAVVALAEALKDLTGLSLRKVEKK